MNIKHTPGPWILNEADGTIRYQHDTGAMICDLADAETRDDQTEANANLIVAAPKMLSALQSAKAEFEARDGAGTCPSAIEELLEEIIGRTK